MSHLPAATEAAREYERSLPHACQTLGSPEQAAQATAHHRIAVAAQILFVQCVLVRLSRFRFHRDFRPQQNRRAQAGINVAVTESLFQNGEGGLASAVNGSEIAHTPVVAQSDRYAVDLVVFRRQ